MDEAPTDLWGWIVSILVFLAGVAFIYGGATLISEHIHTLCGLAFAMAPVIMFAIVPWARDIRSGFAEIRAEEE